MNKKLKNKKAFTIAELVLAMILIAAIAMILMPVLVSNNENQILLTALNKTNTDLQQTFSAITMLEAQGKISRLSPTDPAGTFMEAVKQTHKMVPRQKFAQYIYAAAPTGVDNFDDVTDYTDYNDINNPGNTIILKNTMYITKYDNNTIVVDINGRKQPNKTGKDIFYFGFETVGTGCANEGEILFGNFYDNYNCGIGNPVTDCTVGGAFASPKGNSKGCTAKYLQSGKMD